MNPNAGIYDSTTYRDIFGSPAMRQIWSDETRIQRYLDVERALATAQAAISMIPQGAADEIGRHCRVEEVDFAKLKEATEHTVSPCSPSSSN